MSEQANRTLLLDGDELALLLNGCGIKGLFLPSTVGSSLAEEADVAPALMRLTQAGLMSADADGMLDYAPDLRHMLRVLRDSVANVLLWTAWGQSQPLYLHLSAEGDSFAEIRDDEHRKGGVKLCGVEALPYCDALVRACATARVGVAPSVPALTPEAGIGLVEGTGELFSAWCFRRGSERPSFLARGVRSKTEDGTSDLLVVDSGGARRVFSLDGATLLGLIREVGGR